MRMTIRRLTPLSLLLAFAVAAPVWGADAPVTAAAVCADHPNQASAQRAKDTRDADGDGIYCESLPCPCLKPGSGSPPPPPPPPDPPKSKRKKRAQRIQARITSVVDGDTIKVKAFGAKRSFYTVRLIGIDTPETKKPGTPVECGGPEATVNMEELGFAQDGQGRRVVLTTDPTQDTFDRYGRLLAYVVTTGGTHLQLQQLADGWAKVYVFNRRFRQHKRFRRAQGRARGAKRGVWGDCGGNFHRKTQRRVSLAARFVPCGDITSVGAGVYNVEAKRVGCKHARWVAGRYNAILFGGPGSRAGIGRFRCRNRRLGIELNRATCTRPGGKVVRFEWGA
jgi:endonuclease YncB( thermonuclease family)